MEQQGEDILRGATASPILRRLHIDYESRSPEDLPLVQVYRYAENRYTQVILAAWAIDDEPFEVWRVLRGDPIPAKLRAAILDPSVVLVAHNSNFERVMSAIVGHHQGFLDHEVWDAMRRPERWSCTANRAAACGLPRALENVGHALNLEHKKDVIGSRVMMEMCRPIAFNNAGRPIYFEDEGRMQKLAEYCIKDGESEREADALLQDLSPFEQKVAAVTERMNDRGLLVDVDLLERMIVFTKAATTALNHKLIVKTKGNVPAVTAPIAIIKWLKEQGLDLEGNAEGGKTSLGKWILQGLLEDAPLSDLVREVLVIRRDGGKSSVAKLNAIQRRLNEDNTIRGALIYCGAASTGRWASRGSQLQNLPRGKFVKNPEAAIRAIKTSLMTPETIEKTFGPPLVVASELIRPVFIAPEGYWLARGDYSQIEARVIAWVSDHQRKLDAFRALDAGTGPDIYIVSAADVFGVPQETIDKNDPRRQAGKTLELACGYGGGAKALLTMARLQGLRNLTETEQAQPLVKAWREANQPIMRLGYRDPYDRSQPPGLMDAAFDCMRSHPGRTFEVKHGIAFRRDGRVMQMQMPSGDAITYWYPKLEIKKKFGRDQEVVTYYGEDSQTHAWRRFDMWYGLLLENCTQRIARDFIAYALVNMEESGMKPILSVHDEALCLLDKQRWPTREAAAKAVADIMLVAPPWGADVPLAAEASAADRYLKG